MTSEVIDPLHRRDHPSGMVKGRTGPTEPRGDPAMLTIIPSPLLRQALVADAATSAACGLLMTLAAGPMSGTLGLPEMLLRVVGIVLLPYAAFIGWLGLREQIQRPIAWAVVLGNAIWAADSFLLLASGWVEPTRAGYAFVIAQGLAVLMYAEFQYVGLRRSQIAATA
jgi:hypothetical protein